MALLATFQKCIFEKCQERAVFDSISSLSVIFDSKLGNCQGDCPPRKTVCRENNNVSVSATHTRKSLVKGERFIRYVWMAEIQ